MIWRAQGPEDVSLKSIHFDTESYEGKQVEVSGVVREFQDTGAPYYILEDDGQNRILLRGDPRDLASHVGSRLTAVGVVGFDDKVGIYLDVQSERISSSGASEAPS